MMMMMLVMVLVTIILMMMMMVIMLVMMMLMSFKCDSRIPLSVSHSLFWLSHQLSLRACYHNDNFHFRVVEGVRLADIPSRDILALLDRPGLKSMRDKLAALERLSPLRQSDTYKMVNSRGMEMAVVRVGGFGPSGITNTISYCHTSREGGVWRMLSEVLFILFHQLYIIIVG